MRVVVTGAAGLVGRAVMQHFSGAPAPSPAIFSLTHRDLDITDARAVERRIDDLRPDLIVNCAVLGVDECERDPAAARAINVDGPLFLAAAAERIGGALVHFSSNYVFSGAEERFYAVDDETAPVNVYGKTKAAGERSVLQRCTRALVVRSSWIFGPGKDSFLSTVHRRLIQSGGGRPRPPILAVKDIWASATYVHDLVVTVGALVEQQTYGIHHVVNAGVCSNATFAREAARLVGADPLLVEEVSTTEVHHAPRPRYTPMIGSPPLRDWREALAAYIESDARGDA
jgi:dTDP-4-dehydrorhamnose reductase